MPLNKVNGYDKFFKKKTDLQQNGNSTYISFAFYIRDGLLTSFFFLLLHFLCCCFFLSPFLFAFLWWNKFIWYCCFCTNEIKTITLDTRKQAQFLNCSLCRRIDEEREKKTLCTKSEKVLAVFVHAIVHTRVSVGNHQIRYRYTIQECMQSLSIHGDSLVFVHCQWLNWSLKLYELNSLLFTLNKTKKEKKRK